MVCQVCLFSLKAEVTPERLEEMMWVTRTTLLRIREILHEGSRKARGIAEQTMERVRAAVKLKY